MNDQTEVLRRLKNPKILATLTAHDLELKEPDSRTMDLADKD